MISDKVELEAMLEVCNLDYGWINDKTILVPTENNLVNRECFYHYLKFTAIINQDRTCICGSHQLDDLHHALLTRQDVRGLSKDYRSLIHHTLNTIALCRTCHQSINKDISLEFLSRLYGLDNLRSWYYAVPLRNHPRRI